MRLTLIAGAALAAFAFAAPSPSQAATAQPGVNASPGITLVEGGCGPGGFRAPNGYCYPRRRFYRPCPPGFHPTPYGCRRNW